MFLTSELAGFIDADAAIEDGMSTTELGGREMAGDDAERFGQMSEVQERPPSPPTPCADEQEGETTLPGALVPPPFEGQEPPFTD